jgi:molybdopterin converting factor small subunit
MKIRLKIEGIPALYKLMNKKKDLEITFPGNTLQDLVDGLVSKFGPKVKPILLDKKDEVDIEYRVVVNMSKYLSYGQRMDESLNEGDMVHMMTVG